MTGKFFRMSGTQADREAITLAANAAITELKNKGYQVRVQETSMPMGPPSPAVRRPMMRRPGQVQAAERSLAPTDPFILTIVYIRAAKTRVPPRENTV
jgi:hypothetical protein